MVRRAGGGRTRTRKEEEARESGHGSPGRESSREALEGASSMKEGCEAPGVSRRAARLAWPGWSRACREHGRNRRRGQEPQGRRVGGVATFGLCGRKLAATAAPGVKASGEQESQERRPRRPERSSPSRARDGDGGGAGRSTGSEEEPNVTRGARGNQRSRGQARRVEPRGCRNSVGGAPGARTGASRRAHVL